ncbi:MAG: 1-acyl-sn-glycerol-3-phosphate acyltransferase [Deltaproteobacteria bacterium]|uniref:1-acyl-sn-glycerol-3-phosphate acyltransferase n=1 Tax=Candidatus Zymogenus saltonus TaxID=2844893 RepID=A0A9D8KIM8_9DELT|nr:1-acyl-sn-glycerol-3-phosphate acyltransferase [Candidatus Zymogenus saltonus]
MILDVIYAIILLLVKVGLKLKYSVTIKGAENIPKNGPIILLSNHTTIVDSFLLGCNVPRKIYYMGKSTEFESPAKRIFFYLSRSFPVRRYDIDPGALRNAYRIIEYGGMVGIYPEGERTWDGKLQSLRRGTIRFVLSTGVPVITAGIKNAYQHQPRWGGRIGKPPIVLSFGKPIEVKKIKGKDQKKSDIDDLNDKIVKAILELSE